MAATATPGIARLLVQLDDVSPAIRRRIEVPLNMRLNRLHRVMQIVMGWEDYHLHEFRIGRSISYGEPAPDWDFPGSSRLPAGGASLGDLLARIPGKSKKFTYVYDFGDDWRHTVKLEALVAAEAGVSYPRLIAAERACPPEDVGGPWGYADYLDAIGDPAHPRHAEMLEWRGEGFDPASVDVVAIQRNLEAFAKRSTRRTRAKS
jgi:pRiA4b ORF-3-like protein